MIERHSSVKKLEISTVRFTAASPEDVVHGLLGWVNCCLGGTVRLEGIVVRKTRDGRVVLSYPGRNDERGRRRFYVRPVDDRARRMIEQEVIRQIGIGKDSSS